MFKIVSTRRRGRLELCTVPDSWETNGRLRWPKKNGDVLSKIETVVPEPDWLTFNCVVKRKHFLSYEDAEDELSRMLAKTDTDETDFEEPPVNRNRKVPQKQDFNDMATILIDSGGTSANHLIEDNNIDNSIYINYIEEEAQQPASSLQPCTTQEVSSDLFIAITQNQEKIMKKLAEISVQLEELKESRNPFVCTLEKAEGFQNKKFTMEPITNVTELERFNNQLADVNFFENCLQKYSILCSVARGSGFNCAYRLLDALFSKDILCKCSWTGGSRGEDVKIAFKGYKHIVKFFFSMVRSWDLTYTVENNETFLKSVLRNALKRKDTKNMRKSSKRCKKTEKTKKDVAIADEILNNSDTPDSVTAQNTNNVANPDNVTAQNTNNDADPDNVTEKKTNNINQHENINLNTIENEEEEESLC